MNLTLWHDIMYCVGVFVTCNVGGAALRLVRDGASGLMKRHALAAGASGNGNAAAEQEIVREWKPQSFEEIQREIGRADDARKPDNGSDA